LAAILLFPVVGRIQITVFEIATVDFPGFAVGNKFDVFLSKRLGLFTPKRKNRSTALVLKD